MSTDLSPYVGDSRTATSLDVAVRVFRHATEGTGFARSHVDEPYGTEYIADHSTYVILSRGGRLLVYIPRIYADLTRTRMSFLRKVARPITAESGHIYEALMTLTDQRVLPNRVSGNVLAVFFRGHTPMVDISDTPDMPLALPFDLVHDLIGMGIKATGVCHVLGRALVSFASDTGIRIFYSSILDRTHPCLGQMRHQTYIP